MNYVRNLIKRDLLLAGCGLQIAGKSGFLREKAAPAMREKSAVSRGTAKCGVLREAAARQRLI